MTFRDLVIIQHDKIYSIKGCSQFKKKNVFFFFIKDTHFCSVLILEPNAGLVFDIKSVVHREESDLSTHSSGVFYEPVGVHECSSYKQRKGKSL